MTPGHMTLALGPRKNPQRKVEFLLRLSVYVLIGGIVFKAFHGFVERHFSHVDKVIRYSYHVSKIALQCIMRSEKKEKKAAHLYFAKI